MKIVVYVLATLLGLLGLLFLLAAGQGNALVRVAIGLVLCVGAAIMVSVLYFKPQTHVHQTQLELTGDVSLEKMNCQQCSAELSSKSVQVSSGAVIVHCEYCGAQYQIEEAPKW